MRQRLLAAEGRKTMLHEDVRRAAAAERLIVDTEPRLVIFGFDAAQRDDPGWKRHLKRLKDEFKLKVFLTAPRTPQRHSAERAAGAVRGRIEEVMDE